MNGYSWKDKVRCICAFHGFTEKEVRGLRRYAALVWCRLDVIVMLRNSNPKTWTHPKIGEYLGNRDHSSILNLIRKDATRRKLLEAENVQEDYDADRWKRYRRYRRSADE